MRPIEPFRWHVPLLMLSVLACCTPARAEFSIVYLLKGFTAAQEQLFDQAAAVWKDVITGYQDGITLSGIVVDANIQALDGKNGTLAQAGPSGSRRQAGYRVTTRGEITIDSADLNSLPTSELVSVIAHELGHIIGIGTQWTGNSVYVNGSGRYTGQYGVAAYREEFNASATFVPVELNGGSGTANSHWDELTSVRNADGQRLADELMTGYLSGSNFLSNTTIQSLRDIGFVIANPASTDIVPGDYNGNGVVDAADYTVWKDNFGANNEAADGNQDGRVNAADYTIWKDAFATNGTRAVASTTAASAAASHAHPSSVPEPGCWAITLVIGGALFQARRRRAIRSRCPSGSCQAA
ncbi:MAG: leishmanolysin-related zinc metalloendopeptidase [Pirellulaceae bacterium]|nr:hypothetical protein [Planctomycetales bacterium]